MVYYGSSNTLETKDEIYCKKSYLSPRSFFCGFYYKSIFTPMYIRTVYCNIGIIGKNSNKKLCHTIIITLQFSFHITHVTNNNSDFIWFYNNRKSRIMENKEIKSIALNNRNNNFTFRNRNVYCNGFKN